MSSVRLMFTWEAVQSSLGGPIPPVEPGYANYWSDLTSVIARLLARNNYVILSPWQYNSTSKDTDIVYGNAAFTPANFGNFWGKFAAAINAATGNDQRVAFDLINEPHTHAESGNKPGDIGISLEDWFITTPQRPSCAQAAITAIRAAAVNTIFVPGMAYTAASSFTTNGSSTAWLTLTDPLDNIAVSVHCYTGLGSASPTVLRDACSALVAWARTNSVKINVGEIAINAGSNGRPTFCGTFPAAQAQWADWTRFCIDNDDVLVGWNWWANSAAGNWWNQGDSCDPNGHHWGLTLNDGTTQTVYMDLIDDSLPVPFLRIRDNSADTGSEPNATTAIAWEGSDVWSGKIADGVSVAEPILGGQPSVVYVRVSNTGKAPYPANGTDVVRLYWAKAQTGLSWPYPWDGTGPLPKQGGMIASPQPIGTIPPGQSIQIPFTWATPPNPADFPGNDGHYCLLAFVTKATSPEFEGFQGPDLNLNVLRFNDVAWRNIHIVPVAMRKLDLGDMVVANHTDWDVHAQVGFEILDPEARPVDPTRSGLSIVPRGLALERVREHQPNLANLEDPGRGAFRVRDLATGIPRLDLRSGDVLWFGLEYAPAEDARGCAVRAIQYSVEGESRTVIGGQTFVAGHVEGFTDVHEHVTAG